MNHRCTLIAVPALAVCAVALTTTEAAAKVPEEIAQPGSVAPHDPPAWTHNHPQDRTDILGITAAAPERVVVSVDDGTAEALQASASALGGAGVAFGSLWLYRRRHPLAR
jgi:hypothetical protein